MKIVLVEDDHNQRVEIRKTLEGHYAGAEVETYSTESEFWRAVSSMATNIPDIAIIDVMLKWTNPGPDMMLPPPNAHFMDAGFRCTERLHAVHPDVPVVLYTVLDHSDLDPEKMEKLPPHVRYVSKRSHVDDFFETIDQLTRPSSSPRS